MNFDLEDFEDVPNIMFGGLKELPASLRGVYRR